MRCVRASSVLRQQRKLASGFSIIQLSKYPLCVPILLGKVGFSAKMTVDRALGSAETSMPLRGDKLPEPWGWRRGRSSVVLPFPSAHLSLASVSESIALLGTRLWKMSDEAVVCQEAEKSGNGYNTCKWFHYLRQGQVSLHSFCRTWDLVSFLWFSIYSGKESKL